MSREEKRTWWKPGDVALVTWDNASRARKELGDRDRITRVSLRGNRAWVFDEHARITDDQIAEDRAELNLQIRPLVVIDPDDIEQVERLCDALYGAHHGGGVVARVRNALRKFADPTPAEPTDPSARVTDRRDNIWRLLADGDWVCTSGPDVGEYIAWPRLAAERGPLAVGTDW